MGISSFAKRGRNGLLVVALSAVALVAAACAGGDGPGSGSVPGVGLDAAQIQELARSMGLSPGIINSGGTGIHVTGVGTASAQPDIAVLSLGVEGMAPTVAEANAIAAEAISGMLSVLRAAGVTDDDMETRQFSIQPEYSFEREGGRKLIGYRVTNTLLVTVRDLDGVGNIIDRAAAAGGDATRINSISFQVEEGTALEEQARLLALEDAVAKADLFAAQTGVTRGKLVFITETSFPQFPRTEAFALDARVAGAPAAPTEILAGEFDVRVCVQAVFAID